MEGSVSLYLIQHRVMGTSPMNDFPGNGELTFLLPSNQFSQE